MPSLCRFFLFVSRSSLVVSPCCVGKLKAPLDGVGKDLLRRGIPLRTTRTVLEDHTASRCVSFVTAGGPGRTHKGKPATMLDSPINSREQVPPLTIEREQR
jgi:hypothetical protein